MERLSYKRQSGLVPIGLLASPWLWLAISAVLLSLTGWQLWESWKREAKVRGEYNAFIENVRIAGEQQQAENAKLEAEWRAKLATQRTAAARDRAALRAQLDELRNKPTDPSGREIPISTAAGPGADGLPAKLVPLAEYTSLQERAAYDAYQVTRLQDYITGVCLKGPQ